MHILLGLFFALALLWAWLVGHWFARVLMFLVLVAATFIAGLASGSPPTALVIAICAAVPEWFVAGIPTYYWQRRNRLWA